MPTIEQVPWNYGSGAYYRGLNQPVAVVLHRQQGYRSTARQWALDGHVGASWHYTVGLDGSIMKHLAHSDGGFHAGVVSAATGVPTWSMWRGDGVNVNTYTLGVECEGFAGGDWPEAQLASLKWLCQRLAGELGVPYDRDHFPPHADINIRDRVNDFDTPERRRIVYDYLFKEEDAIMTDDDLLAIFAGSEEKDADGNLLPREERLTNARYRRDEAAAGRAPSIRDLAASAWTNAEAVARTLIGHIGTPHSSLAGVTAEDIAQAITGGAKFAADGIRFAAQRGSGG